MIVHIGFKMVHLHHHETLRSVLLLKVLSAAQAFAEVLYSWLLLQRPDRPNILPFMTFYI